MGLRIVFEVMVVSMKRLIAQIENVFSPVVHSIGYFWGFLGRGPQEEYKTGSLFFIPIQTLDCGGIKLSLRSQLYADKRKACI